MNTVCKRVVTFGLGIRRLESVFQVKEREINVGLWRGRKHTIYKGKSLPTKEMATAWCTGETAAAWLCRTVCVCRLLEEDWWGIVGLVKQVGSCIQGFTGQIIKEPGHQGFDPCEEVLDFIKESIHSEINLKVE